MLKLLIILALGIAGLAANAGALRSPLSKQFLKETLYVDKDDVDPGQPLFLTPYIEKGDIKTAQKLSMVGPLEGTSLKSYSGFLTVDKTYNSSLFFWFFPSETKPTTAPVLLWLQGGPGGSSLFGLFVENGPFSVDKDMKLHPREHAWSKEYSVVYIDNPAGTGFSFTSNDKGYATNETQVGINLYNALAQFFTLFPEYKNNDFYITGESYAGKYIPAVTHQIHNEPHPKKVLLRGIAIGDGWTDPVTMVPTYADYMFNIGLLDENEREEMRKMTDNIVKLIQQKEYLKANQMWNILLNGDLTTAPTFFYNATGLKDYYNFMRTQSPAEFEYNTKYLNQAAVRKAIHVGSLPYNSGAVVEKHLEADIMQSVKPWLAEAMHYYKVMLYSGQLDIIVALPLTEAMLQTVDWVYKDEYLRAKKLVWRIKPNDPEVAGYVRNVHDFYQVVVRGAGHILPYDQPERALDMLNRFIYNRSFN